MANRQTFCKSGRIRCLGSLTMTRDYISGAIISCTLMLLISCGEKPDSAQTRFTKADSLTETYLALQDSVLQAWNVMINDDNQKIEAMHALLHELMVSGAADQDALKSYEERLDRLRNLRYTQKSMANPDVITEYDFASNALIAELVSLAETERQFAYNTTLQKLVEDIRVADERVMEYREAYDNITAAYNNFLNQNRAFLRENNSDSLEVKPTFQMVFDD
jgi:hypothetical protein